MNRFLRTGRARALVALAAGALGTAGLLGALPLSAQESTTPTDQDRTTSTSGPFQEGGGRSSNRATGPRSSGGRTENLAADLTR